jgi:low temperature requirement protein LtrA
MSTAPQGHGAFRTKVANQHHRVTFVELVYDLVFVFAITQVSHSLVEHYSGVGAAQTLFLLLAVWWVWVYTSWAVNWLNPDHFAVRLTLFAMMLAGLMMSASIPDAFAHRGLTFGLAYAAMQVGRAAVVCLIVPASSGGVQRNFRRILIWLAFAGVFWIAGAFAQGETRVVLWIVALGLEIVGPLVRFWTPGLGASSLHDWNVEGGHMAERYGLFVIIALGESILVTGATFAKEAMTPMSISAFLVCFVGSIAMWWIYFDKGAELGARQLSTLEDPGALARLGYTYMHLPIVGGVVLAAVSDDFVLAHPATMADTAHAWAIVGGPALFLAGNMGFKRALRGWYQPSHLVGLVLLLFLFSAPMLGIPVSQIVLAALAALVLIMVSVWERLSLGAAADEA